MQTHPTYATAWPNRKEIFQFLEPHMPITISEYSLYATKDGEMIKGNYEYETCYLIMNYFKNKNINYKEVEKIFVSNHAPYIKRHLND